MPMQLAGVRPIEAELCLDSGASDLAEIGPPIVVDLDGTLVSTDTLVESVVRVVRTAPLNVLRIPGWLVHGRAAFKQAIGERCVLPVEHLPYHEQFLAYLREEKSKGRQVILATAAHATIARRVGANLDLFDHVIASEAGSNLKGRVKLAAIRRTLPGDFVYAGDSAADLPIWKAAHRAILVGVPLKLAAEVSEHVPVEREFSTQSPGIGDWMRTLRVHQWVKNVLLFVPLLTSFGFLELRRLVPVLAAFALFSLAASATYIANDLWDLDSDRSHPRKRMRGLASGKIPIVQGMVVAGLMLLVSAGGAWALSSGFFLMLLAYLVLTTAYSLVFKGYVLIDVLMLAALYTFRILAGSVVAGASTSSWLLAFSFFFFLSLALVKRCSELLALQQVGRQSARGRDYQVSDLVVLWPFGAASALSAVVVFGLFISAPDTEARYATPHLLWLVAVGMVYWLGRLWIKTSRGEMHDDPIVFAIKDRGSRLVLFSLVVTTLLAHYVPVPVP